MNLKRKSLACSIRRFKLYLNIQTIAYQYWLLRVKETAFKAILFTVKPKKTVIQHCPFLFYIFNLLLFLFHSTVRTSRYQGGNKFYKNYNCVLASSISAERQTYRIRFIHINFKWAQRCKFSYFSKVNR